MSKLTMNTLTQLDMPHMRRVDYWNMKARTAESQRDELLVAAKDAMEIGNKKSRDRLVAVIGILEAAIKPK